MSDNNPSGNIHHHAPGALTGLGIAIGVALGFALGVALDDLAVGISIGAGIGVVVGSALERGQRGLEPGESAYDDRSLLVIGLGMAALVGFGILLLMLLLAR